MHPTPRGLDMSPPIDARREVLYAIVPPVFTFAAASATSWLHAFAQGSTVTDLVFVACVVLTMIGAIAIVATAFLGRLREIMKRVFLVMPLLVLLTMLGPIVAIDQFVLATRGVQVECEVISKRDYVRSSGVERTDHEFACPGWPSFNEDTDREEQLPLGHDVIATIDPLDKALPSLREVSTQKGIVTVLVAAGLLIVLIIGRLVAVDDGSIRTEIASTLRRLQRLRFRRRAAGARS